jgi:hypothetical protein
MEGKLGFCPPFVFYLNTPKWLTKVPYPKFPIADIPNANFIRKQRQKNINTYHYLCFI